MSTVNVRSHSDTSGSGGLAIGNHDINLSALSGYESFFESGDMSFYNPFENFPAQNRVINSQFLDVYDRISGLENLTISVGDSIDSATNNLLFHADGSGQLAQTSGFQISGGTLLAQTLSSKGASDGTNSESFGAGASATGTNATTLGQGASATGNSGVAIGQGAVCDFSGNSLSVSIGKSASVTSQQSVGIGVSVSVTQSQSTVVGYGASGGSAGNTVYGSGATGSGTGATAVGRDCSVTFGGSSFSTGLGQNCTITGQLSTVIGYGSSIDKTGACAYGYNASASGGNYSQAYGAYATTTGANQFVAGSSNGSINNVYFGKGVVHASPTAYAINGTGGTGTDIIGGDIIIAGGRPTGAGVGGSIKFQTAPAGASGITLRTLITRLEITSAGVSGFTSAVTVPDEAYGSGWNGKTEVPTKNAVYDKFESLTSSNISDFNEAVDDEVNLLITGSDTIVWDYDDLDGTLTGSIAELDSGWSATKTTARKTVDASTDTVEDVANTVGTLIELFLAKGILGA